MGSTPGAPAGTGRGAPVLKRNNSSGSMTERTFRSPSPNRGSPARASIDVPPVPAIPQHVNSSLTSQRPRASSLDTQARLNSPEPKIPRGRGVSLDAGSRSSLQNSRPETPRLQNIQEMSRENSRRSINFSRPISPQLGIVSDPLNRPPKQTGWFTGPVQSGQPARGERVSQRQIAKPPPIPENNSETLRTQHIGQPAPQESSEVEHGSGRLSRTVASPSSNRAQASSGLAASIWNSMTPEAKDVSRAAEQQTDPRAEAHSGADTQEPAEDARPRSIPLQIPSPPPAAPGPELLTKQMKQASPRSGRQIQRSGSLSPPRNAHFSNGLPTVVNGLRHEPPGRSASPVKSAIKHYRSASAKTNSPPGSLLGETIDTSDLESPKRKKSTRVSFEEPKPDLSGLQASKFAPSKAIKATRPPVEANDNLEDIMGPRPALPSFGSIRGQNRIEDRQLTSAAGDRWGSGQETRLEESMPSSDHAVGGILRQNLLAGKGTRRQDGAELLNPLPPSNDPLPPEVTSVEGTGYFSDSDGSIAPTEVLDEKPAVVRVDAKTEQIVSPVESQGESLPQEAIPQLSLQPPTPAVETERRLVIPGAFPDSFNDENLKEQESHDGAQPTSTLSVRFAEDQDESSSDNDSVYSDAEENLDNGGFASLDAVLERSTKLENSEAPEEKHTSIDIQRPTLGSIDTSTLDKRLDEAEMNSLEQSTQADSTVGISEEVAPKPVTVEQAATPKELPLEYTTVAGPPSPPASPTGLSTSKWSSLINKTKAAAGVNRARSPPRNVRASSPTQPSQPRSANQPPFTNRPTKQSPRSKYAPTPIEPLQRSNSNDSASSFQRQRLSPRRQRGQPTMRSTLRSPDGRSSQRAGPPATNTSLRAQSPSGPTHHMRSSLRVFSGESTAPSRRDQDSKKRALSPSRLTNMMRLKKSSKSKDSKTAQETSGSRFQSRFANDSDDDEMPRRAFASRFEDSDDDLDVILPKVEATARPSGLPPVRGIPRRAGEEDGDSTDLSDSESFIEPASPLPPVPSARDVHKAHMLPLPKGSPITRPNEESTGLLSSKFAPKANSPPVSDKAPKRPSFISSLSGQSQSWHSHRFPHLVVEVRQWIRRSPMKVNARKAN